MMNVLHTVKSASETMRIHAGHDSITLIEKPRWFRPWSRKVVLRPGGVAQLVLDVNGKIISATHGGEKGR